MRPIWSDLAHTRDPARLWQRSQSRFTSNVLGGHFEQLARHWTRYFAPEEIVSGFPSRVGQGTVNDPASKKTRQVDVVAVGHADDERETLLAIGEVKWHETMGMRTSSDYAMCAACRPRNGVMARQRPACSASAARVSPPT